jgi:2-polyprenyl-6-methoxyphenol hydroxylase-like FAD-dependent oxidoreductase
MKICVVGGGTAGFVSALILKSSYPSYTVDIIKSSNIPTIGVGEGSTEHWSRFMDFVGIQAGEMIKECDATFKTGIMFKDWGGRDYLQNVHSHYSADRNGFPIVYSKLMSQDVDPRKLTGDYLWDLDNRNKTITR